MQPTGSTASSGWSRRTRIIVGITVLGLLVAWLGVNMVDCAYPGATWPPSTEREAEVVSGLTALVRQEYGPALASVRVWYARDGLVPTFFGRYRLHGVPLVFSFSERYVDLAHYGPHGPTSPATAGGLKRFIQLATAFHADFPDAATMDWMAVESDQLPASLRHLAAHRGPTVVVYGSHESSSALGIYAWDAQRKAWGLVRRGPLPEV